MAFGLGRQRSSASSLVTRHIYKRLLQQQKRSNQPGLPNFSKPATAAAATRLSCRNKPANLYYPFAVRYYSNTANSSSGNPTSNSNSNSDGQVEAKMQFASDNWAGAHPAIAASLATHAAGFAAAYGTSDVDAAMERKFSEIFEKECSVFFVGTGTAANSLALTSVAKPGGVVFAHREAHIAADECGAPEYLSAQLRIRPVDGANGKMDPAKLRKEMDNLMAGGVHGGRPNAVSVTQTNEAGAVYSLRELDAIAEVAREYKVPLHMDGARFANALVSLGCSPAEMTWKRGVELLSFGATKNGCWCAEAVVLFDTAKAEDFHFLRKRSAQLFSKTRFISAQFEAYFRDDLWLELARNANGKAMDIAGIFDESKTSRLVAKPQSNEVFVVLKKDKIEILRAAGATFYPWPVPAGLSISDDEELCRFVTSFATTEEDVTALSSLVNNGGSRELRN